MTPSGQAIPFVKASACGNDFLIIDSVDAPKDIQELSKRLCDRHLGIGADGVEWLFPAGDADVAARLINADGSEAEISGNGTRGVAAYLCSEKPRERLAIHTFDSDEHSDLAVEFDGSRVEGCVDAYALLQERIRFGIEVVTPDERRMLGG